MRRERGRGAAKARKEWARHIFAVAFAFAWAAKSFFSPANDVTGPSSPRWCPSTGEGWLRLCLPLVVLVSGRARHERSHSFALGCGFHLAVHRGLVVLLQFRSVDGGGDGTERRMKDP